MTLSVAAKGALPPALFLLIAVLSSISVRGQTYNQFTTRTPLPEGHTLIVGFQGGRHSWDDDKRGVRKFALKLRRMNLLGVHVETVENRKRARAVELIRNAFDRDRNGRLDDKERAAARVILYGQSFGGAAVAKLARQLQKLDIPVLLTVQVDSVGKDDDTIPANVLSAANLFQRDGWLIKGEDAIRAEDPNRTSVIGNFKFTYAGKKIDISEAPWYAKIVMVAHARMEYDPEVWAKVEELVLNEVRKSAAAGAR